MINLPFQRLRTQKQKLLLVPAQEPSSIQNHVTEHSAQLELIACISYLHPTGFSASREATFRRPRARSKAIITHVVRRAIYLRASHADHTLNVRDYGLRMRARTTIALASEGASHEACGLDAWAARALLGSSFAHIE